MGSTFVADGPPPAFPPPSPGFGGGAPFGAPQAPAPEPVPPPQADPGGYGAPPANYGAPPANYGAPPANYGAPPADFGAPQPAPAPLGAPSGFGAPTPAPTASSARVSKRLLLVPLVGVVVVAVLAIGGITAIVNAIRDNTTSGVLGALDHQDANVISVQGYTDLLDAVREQSGSTTAFSAVLYPTYAVVELPVDHRTAHEEYWYWDGSELTSNDIKSSSSFPRTDLASVDPQVVVDLVRKVRSKMPDEDTWYAIVRAPDESGAAVWAYASNDFGDTVYLGARPDGRVTWDSTQH